MLSRLTCLEPAQKLPKKTVGHAQRESAQCICGVASGWRLGIGCCVAQDKMVTSLLSRFSPACAETGGLPKAKPLPDNLWRTAVSLRKAPAISHALCAAMPYALGRLSRDQSSSTLARISCCFHFVGPFPIIELHIFEWVDYWNCQRENIVLIAMCVAHCSWL